MECFDVVFTKCFRDIHRSMLLQIGFNVPFYDDYGSPRAIKPGMLFINAYFAKAKQAYKRPAGFILNEDSRDQRPETRVCRGLHYSVQRPAACSATAHCALGGGGSLSKPA